MPMRFVRVVLGVVLLACLGIERPTSFVEESAVQLAREGVSESAWKSDSARALTLHPDQGVVRWSTGAAWFETVALGRMGRLLPVEAAQVRSGVVGEELRRELGGGVTEWWREARGGLEHGVTLEARPRGEGPLVVEIASSLSPRLLDADAIALLDAEGRSIATYRHLVVLDADGARVPAHMTVRGERIGLVVDDAEARYPLVIDPLFALEEEPSVTLEPNSRIAQAAANAAVDVVVVGRQVPNAVDVYERTGTTWSRSALPRPPSPFIGIVSIDDAGDRIAVSTRTAGAASQVEIWDRDGASWAMQRVFAVTNPRSPVAVPQVLSGDGRRLAVGDADGVDVYVEDGGSWTHEMSLFHSGTSSMWLAFDTAGTNLAVIDDDGFWRIWHRTGGGWVVGSMGNVPGRRGHGVAMSRDGTRVALGSHSGGVGRVDVRLGSAGIWLPEASLVAGLPPSHPAGDDDAFGSAIAFNANGSRVIVGAQYVDGDRGAEHYDVGAVMAFQRTGTTWSLEETVYGRAADGRRFGSSVAIDSAGTRALVVAPAASDIAAPGLMRNFRIFDVHALGEACTRGQECASGHCVDGVCCDSACGGTSTSDCQACVAALTGAPSGTCAPLAVTVAPSVVCRASTGVCDPAEACVAGSMDCPLDAMSPATTVCRAAVTLCDAQELCTGSSALCPADAPATSGTVCREAVSRCDVREICDGTGFGCPGDVRAASDTVCREALGACDLEERCDGVEATCPNDGFVATGTICAPAGPGVCDAPDVCTGTSADCVRTFLSGVECRASAGACDPAEVCSGTSELCPPDAVQPAATVCRAAASGCDLVESCDGVAAQCPPDETSCAGDVDAGTPTADAGTADAGTADGGTADAASAPIDASGTADAAMPASSGTGCACRVPGATPTWRALSLLAIGLLLARRSRRRFSRS